MYKSALTLIFTSFGASGAQFVVGILIARMLGAEGRGEYALFLLWAQFFGTFGVGGLDIALARRAADRRISGRWLMGAMLVVGGGLALLAVLIGIAASAVLVPAHGLPAKNELWLMMALFIPASIFSAVSQAVLLGRSRFKLFSLVRLTSPLALMLCISLTTMNGAPTPWTLALAACGANIITMVVGLITVAASGRGEGFANGRAGMGSEMVGFSGQLAVETILSNFPAVLVANLASLENLGHFTIAVTATSAVTLAIQPLSKLLFARVAAHDSAGEDSTLLALRGFRIAAIGILVSGLALGPGLPLLVPLVFGKSFAISGLIAAALIPSTLTVSLSSFLDESLRARGAAKIGLIARIANLLTLAVCGFGFGTLWGVYGVVLGLTIASVTRLGILVFGSRAKLGVPMHDFIPSGRDVNYLLTSVTAEMKSKLGSRWPKRPG